MKRKDFIKSVLLTTAVGLIPNRLKSVEYFKEQNIKTIGYNHLPNKEIKKMNSILHKANSRGNANHGWLNSYHSFSFANYHNPERMNFGVLRVLNDDEVKAGKGFGTHKHENMEIISIPLEGDLEHKDSMNNATIIKEGDVQVMSAGSGIYHSEYNKNENTDVKFLQIWVIPNKLNVKPRYDQISIRNIKKENELYQILSPNENDEGVWVHQNAWFHIGDYSKDTLETYKIKQKGNGIYAFVLEGSFTINDEILEKRDAIGIWDIDKVDIKSSANSRILLMEVPMQIN